MAIYRYGTFQVPTANAAISLNLGFVPSEFRMINITRLAAATTPSVNEGWWNATMGAQSTPFSMLGTWTAGAVVWSKVTTNGILPYQTPDSLLFVPKDFVTAANTAVYQTNKSTYIPILTGISKAANAVVTTTHSFQQSDVGVTKVTFHNVVGMTEINTLTGTITAVTSTTSFAVNIDSTNFGTFVLSGNPGANVITGAPVSTVYSGTQILNTSEANLGFIGLTIGTDFMGGTGVVAADTYAYTAILQSPATGP